ncbi:MAG: Gfo/Idh/MocA family oxidoreductase [Verrucomicrobia bacterium]|nr:Gfo/Idh/MocA family oxidoreductase [Verrucomicrobiota bacterium]
MKNQATSVSQSRREFLRSSAALTAATFAGPFIAPSSVFGASAPSKRITLGIIGCGNQSTVDIPEWLKHDDCQIVAVCDVNRASYGYKNDKQFLGWEPQRDFVNQAYAKKAPSGRFQGVSTHTDFREVLARPDIDAVAIITPDHWHAVMTVLAARAGKDIYCQKPLTLTVAEGREMIAAVRKHRRILQTGSQYRSHAVMRRACELVRNGRIGKLQRVETYVAENNFKGPGPGWKEMPVPPNFDYERWLGPAPQAPYHHDRCLYRFRFVSDYSGGQTTNFGCHSNNVAHWGMNRDHSGPIEIEDLGAEYPPKGDLFNTATKVAFRARYEDGVVLECKTDKRSFGVTFFGSEGWLRVLSKGIETEPASLAKSELGPNEFRLPVSLNHYRNFLDCVKSRQEPMEPVEIGHRTASLCHLGNIAMQLHRKIRWDPKKEQIIGDAEAARLLARPLRAPYGYDYPLKA